MYVEMEKKQPFDYIKELRLNWNKKSDVEASVEEVRRTMERLAEFLFHREK